MATTTSEDVCFILESDKMCTTKKRRRGGEKEEGGKAENGEQLCLVGATRPADVFRQRYPAEGEKT